MKHLKLFEAFNKEFSDYSKFIPDRFNGKSPQGFFRDIKLEFLKDKNRIEEVTDMVKDFYNEDEAGDAPMGFPVEDGVDLTTARVMSISTCISHYLFYDVFDLEDKYDDDLLAPGCLIHEEYSDNEEIVRTLISSLYKTIFKESIPVVDWSIFATVGISPN